MQHYRYCCQKYQPTDSFISQLSDDKEHTSSNSNSNHRKRESVLTGREEQYLVGKGIDTKQRSNDNEQQFCDIIKVIQ